MQIKKGVSGTMYTFNIQVEADGPLFPYELKNTGLAAIAVEGAVACSLEGLFTEVIMKEVNINPSPRDIEQDWDALLPRKL